MRFSNQLFVLILGLMAAFGLQAQSNNNGNGNAVVSEVSVTDQGNGYAIIEARVSGNLSEYVNGATFEVSGDRVNGTWAGRMQPTNTRPVPGPGNTPDFLVAYFPILPSGTGSDMVQVSIELRGTFPNHYNRTTWNKYCKSAW